MSVFHSHLQLKPVSVVCWVQPPPDTKYSGLNYKNREEMKVHLNIILIIDYKMSFNCYFCFIYIYIWPTWWPGTPLSESLILYDPLEPWVAATAVGLNDARSPYSAPTEGWKIWTPPEEGRPKKKKPLKKTQKVAESFWAKLCPAAP